MENDGQAFKDRELADGGCVEEDGHEDERHCEQCSMPALNNEASVADGNEGEHLLCGGVCHGRHCALPPDDAKPSNRKGELFLEMARSKF